MFNKLTKKSVRHRTFQPFCEAKQRWGAKTSHWYVNKLDQYQYLGNCPPTPPLTQRQP